MAIGLENRGMDNQAILGDAQTAFEAEIAFVFGRTVAKNDLLNAGNNQAVDRRQETELC